MISTISPRKLSRFLGLLCLFAFTSDPTFGQSGLESKTTPIATVKVALYDSKGTGGVGPKMLLDTFAKDGGFPLTRITVGDIKAAKLKEYQVLIIPGGTSATIGKALGENGREEIRTFVKEGGTYVGICAGCYLSTCQYPWSLRILPAKVVDPANSYRGRAKLRLEPTPEGKKWFARNELKEKSIYHNGPVLQPLPDEEGKLISLAYYREEITRKGAEKGLMIDTPAVAAARYGKGWVVGISPHPEQTAGLKDIVPAVIRWSLRDSRKD